MFPCRILAFPAIAQSLRFYMTDKRVVLTTCGSQEEGRQIARALIERRLAACINIVPHIESVYQWEGKIETANEWLLVIKTTAGVIGSLQDAVQELHSYKVPEFLVLSVEDGSAAYLDWIGESVGGPVENV
jgi:periplasmic divalent cation tolerance protein